MKPTRNPESVAGDWYIDSACIDCGASRHVAPNLIVERHGKSVFARQPTTPEDSAADTTKPARDPGGLGLGRGRERTRTSDPHRVKVVR